MRSRLSHHIQGRGLILDEAEVNRAAYLSRDSRACGRSRIRDARLLFSSGVGDDAQVFGGTLIRSYVGGRTAVAGDPLITHESIIQCASVSGRARINRSQLYDAVEVWDEPILDDVILRGGIYVYGQAVLQGPFEMDGFARIDRGFWERAPRTLELPNYTITESLDGVMVGCRYMSYEYWLRHGRPRGEREGWSSEEIELALATINEWYLTPLA